MYRKAKDFEIPYNLPLIGSNSFVLGSLENHVNNLSELYDCDCKDKSKQQIKIKYDKVNIHTICKTLTTLENKESYLVHIQALKQALLHGLELKKVHRVISFRQEAWLKPYIDKNAKLRKDAKNEFENAFFKLMNNAVFGKTMENVRNCRDVKLVVTEERRKKLLSEPNYDSCKQFSENLMAIEMRKTKVLMDKPIAVVQAVLDISKTLMYEFWYDYLKPMY